MYSNNDFRSYQELYHADGKKAKWTWLPGGKNTPEYNHWYYMTHPEKWGIVKAGQQALDAAGNAINKFVEGTETDLDDKALAGLKSGYNTAKNAVTSTNAYKNAKNIVGDVRRSTEALQRRDEANKRADQADYRANYYGNKANSYANKSSDAKLQAGVNRRDAAMRELEGNTQAARAMNRSAIAYTSKSANANKQAERYRGYQNTAQSQADRNRTQANQAATTSKAYLNKAINDVKEPISNAGKYIVNKANDAATKLTRKTDTMADDFALRSLQRLAGGDKAGAKESWNEAVRRGKNDLKTAINNKIDNSDTYADNWAREAYRNLRDGNPDLAKYYGRSAVKAATNDVKKTLGNAVDAVGNTVNKLKNAAEGYGAYKDWDKASSKKNPSSDDLSNITDASRKLADARSKEGGATGAKIAQATSTAKKNSIEAAQQASRTVKSVYDNAMKELGNIREQYGQNSKQYLEALKDIKDDAIDAIDRTGSQLRIKFYSSAGTIASEMSSGAEWIANTFDNLISREEIAMMEFEPDETQAQQRRQQQQNETDKGKYTAYMNEEAERRRNESQKKK